MHPHAHGGDIFCAARELGCAPAEILDFSASINPLGMPAEVRQAAANALDLSVHYPEADAASLTAALAAHLELPPANLLPGSGSTELLYLFPRILRLRRALLVTPAFGEYTRSLSQTGTKVDLFPLAGADAFRLDPERLLQALQPEHDLVLLANPGNPTGAVIEPAVIEAIAAALRGQALLAVDEAFIDFCPQHSVINRVLAHDNLYVFRSLTKFYAIPGLRAGYLAGPAAGIAPLAAAALPWTLSTPALAAAVACLAAAEFRRQTLTLIPQLRQQLATGLAALGLHVHPSAANFLLLRLPPGEASADWAAALRQRRLLVRDCRNFPPLDDRYLRVAVRTADENARLLQAVEEMVAGKGQDAPAANRFSR